MNVEVAVLRSPSLIVRAVCVAIKQTQQAAELRSYAVKVELAVLGPLFPNSLYGLCGRKATLNLNSSELRSCVNVDVAVLGPLP